jgi:peptidoglycan/LPS O-acetylase OafA/YrhL
MFGLLWSLAVDEQFYFAWPPVIRNLQRGTLIRIPLGVLTLKPLLRVLISPHVQTYWIIYAFTPFRLDILQLALVLEDPQEHLSVWLSSRPSVCRPVKKKASST